MPTTWSVIPPVVPWTAAAGAAVRLLQAGHMVVPSAICVPHPLQKAIDVPPVIVQLGPWTWSVRPYLNPAKVIRISLPRQTESQGRGFKRSRSGDGTGRALPVNTIPVIG